MPRRVDVLLAFINDNRATDDLDIYFALVPGKRSGSRFTGGRFERLGGARVRVPAPIALEILECDLDERWRRHRAEHARPPLHQSWPDAGDPVTATSAARTSGRPPGRGVSCHQPTAEVAAAQRTDPSSTHAAQAGYMHRRSCRTRTWAGTPGLILSASFDAAATSAPRRTPWPLSGRKATPLEGQCRPTFAIYDLDTCQSMALRVGILSTLRQKGRVPRCDRPARPHC
jgi:hypothetical protein